MKDKKWKIVKGVIIFVLVIGLGRLGYRWYKNSLIITDEDRAEIHRAQVLAGKIPSTNHPGSIQATVKNEDTVTITDEWLNPPITVLRPQSQRILSNVIRDDLWHEVEIDGGPEKGGVRYQVPPWSTWNQNGWKAPKHIGSSIRVRLIPELNGGVREARWTYKIVPI